MHRFLTTAALVALVAAAAIVPGCGEDVTDARAIRVPDLDGATVAPLAATDTRPVLILFTRTDCPISNRYAPEVRRLHEALGDRVDFWLVYPDADTTVEAIRKHLDSYKYTCGALRDPDHALVKLTSARITPEAAVFTTGGEMVYRGRIDNRYEGFGQSRREPSRNDLEEALMAVLDGRPVEVPRTEAVGCYISDLEPASGHRASPPAANP